MRLLTLVIFFAEAAIAITKVDLGSLGFVNDTQLELNPGLSWSGGMRSSFNDKFSFVPTAKEQPARAFLLSLLVVAKVTKAWEGFCLCGPTSPLRVSTLECGLEAGRGNTISFTTDAPLHRLGFKSFKSLINPAALPMSYVRTASFSSSSSRGTINPIVWVVEGEMKYFTQSASFRAIFPIAYNSAGVAILR